MLFVRRLEFENFGPFAGKHSVELCPGVHAVVAATEDDGERSNWVGKSTFLSAIPFVLHGWHMHRTEDEFITGGHGLPDAPFGGVTMTLSDGTWARRTRKRGASTQLVVKFPLREEQSGAVAQAALLQHIGFGESDFFEAAFFKQKDMARFVSPALMQPSERQELVRKWFELEPLERCEAACWQRANAAQAELDALDKPAAEAQMFWHRVAAQLGMPNVETELPAAIAETRAHIEALQASIQERSGEALARAAALRFMAIDTEGRATKAQLDAIEPVTDVEVEDAKAVAEELRQELGPIRHEHQQAAAAQFGKFDGKCPVAGIGCPATEQINGMGEQLVSHCALLKKQRDAKEVELRGAQEALDTLTARYRARERLQAKLDALRPQAKQALIESNDWKPLTPEEEAFEAGLEPALQALQRKLAELEALAREGARLAALVPGEAKRREVETRVLAARAGARIYKRVTRSVAETSLATIEAGTNRLLAGVGIDLSVEMAWAREGKDPATSCDECGAPYPKSAKVKECARCGAKRGPKLVERLDVVLSNVSGAADDLAGIALRLALGSWLRNRRGAQWSTTCIDEPFGSLDVAHRKVLTKHLATLLGAQHGFVQAFVVAHDRAICDSLPHRVELVGTKQGTRFA